MARDSAQRRQRARERRRLQILGLTTLVGAALVGSRLLSRGPQAAQADAPTATDTPAFETTAVMQHRRVDVDWPVTLERDVFATHDTDIPLTAVPVETLRAEAAATVAPDIIVVGNPSTALIGDTACRVGDSVNGYRIVAIESRHIVVERQGVQVVVPLRANP